MKYFIKKSISKGLVFVSILAIRFLTSPVFALGFDENKAKADLSKFLTPIFAVAMWLATLTAGGMIYTQYTAWKLKDEDERQPFIKIVKKELFAFVGAMMFGMVLTWLSF